MTQIILIYTDKTKNRFSLIRIFMLLLFLAVIYSCSSLKKASKPRNFDSLYDPAYIPLFPEIQVNSETKSTLKVHVRIRQQELLFNQANEEKKLQAKIKIKYTLYQVDETENLADSGSVFHIFDKDQSAIFHEIEFLINAEQGKNYFLEIDIADINRDLKKALFRSINRKEKFNQQDFIIFNPESQEIYYNPFIKSSQPFSIKHYNQDFDSLFVSFYKNDFYTPLPPNRHEYISDTLDLPDSTFIYHLDSINFGAFNTEGIFCFSTAQNSSIGFCLFNFGEGFPGVVTPCELLEPLNYITNLGDCARDTTNGRLTKLAVDNFWLSKAKNISRSRELIKLYYGRVMYANMFFTSYKPGWQTDRGMIYIVYGQPDYLYKSAKEERWIYSPQDLGPAVVFNFENLPHKFSTNHFLLNREKQKTTGWEDVVKLWNSGEVYYYQP